MRLSGPSPVPVPAALALNVAGGLLLSLAFPPAELWPLAFVALIPLLWSLRGSRPGRGALLGLVFGLAFFGATLYWIFLFGALAWFALTALSAASIAAVGAIAPSMLRVERPIRSAIGFAALWTAVDWIRDAFGHLKVIGVLESGLGLAEEAGVEEDHGVVEMDGSNDIAAFITAAKNGRVWDREPRLRTPK